jgi:hypothetical protein
MRAFRSAAPLLALLGACSLDAPQQFLVPDLRILAVRSALPAPSNSADADVGETVTLQALVANPRGRGPVTVDWYACAGVPPPGQGASASPCRDPDRLRDLATFPSTAGTVRDGILAVALGTDGSTGEATADLDLATWGATLGLAAEVARIQAASAVPLFQCQLQSEIPIVAVVRAPGLAEAALRSVRLHPESALDPLLHPNHFNLNPAFPASGGVLAGASDPSTCTDGTPLEAATLAGETRLCAALAGGSIDTYAECGPSGPSADLRQEEIAWQWYVTAGELADVDFDGNATSRDVTLTPARGSSTLWVIARDGRGGTGWRRWDLVVP